MTDSMSEITEASSTLTFNDGSSDVFQPAMVSRDPHIVSLLPEYACSYCGCCDEHAVVKCNVCNRWFCNGRSPASRGGSKGGSHIVTHLVMARHNAVSLHPSSELGDTALECYKCGNRNVFVLGFVAAKQESVVVLLCRMPCAQSKNPDWDTDHWQALIEDRQLLPWVAKQPTEDEMARGTPISASQISQLEAKWRTDKSATIADLEKETAEVEAVPILMRYTDAFQYQRSFAPLVKLEADYDRQTKESKALEHISVRWSLALNSRHLASFTFSTYESADFKVAVGDEMILRYNGSELPHPWEESGYIVRLPDASQEEFTIELNGAKSEPPTHVTTGFTAEFVWKGISYDRMQAALRTFAVDSKSVSEYIYYKLLGKDTPESLEFDTPLPGELSVKGGTELNVSQLNAVRSALTKPLSLIQGPPGTGKTVTSATIVYHLCKIHKEKVMVCAPSNVAVDHLALKLVQMGLKVVRVVARSREDVDSSVEKCCLNTLIKAGAKGEFKKLIKKKEEVGELSERDSKVYFGHVKRAEKQVLSHCEVICCTCVGAADKRLLKMKFHSVLIDESTQASEPECLIPIVKGAKQVVLVGDHQQLGPVILNKKAGNAGLQQSLFERLIFLGHTPLRLEVQYRMHPALSEFPSNMFYDGSLQNGVTAEERRWPGSSFPWPIRDIPMMFWAVYGREEISASGTSYLNRVEAMNVERIITRLFKDGVTADQIGVITPYEGQRAYISLYMQMNGTAASEYANIEVVSVDAFQGREKDFIILSCVRANDQQLIGFLRDPRRLNVALTRARLGCIVLGNPRALSRDRLWNYLLSYYRDCGCLVEGQLDNLQISTVQLSRPKPKYKNPKSGYTSGYSTAAPSEVSQRSFETASLVSYEGSTFASGLSNRSVWPTIEEAHEQKNDETSTIVGSTDGIDGDFEIKELTGKFAGEFTF